MTQFRNGKLEPMAIPRVNRRRLPLWLSALAGFLISLVLVSLVQHFIFKPYRIPSASMEPTLAVGDLVVVDRFSQRTTQPEAGDIVVFDASKGWSSSEPGEDSALKDALKIFGDLSGIGPSNAEPVVKRIIGVPYDAVECCSVQGQILVNGTGLSEPYIQADFPFEPGVLDCSTRPKSLRCFSQVVLPESSYLVLGDNRSNSSDGISQCRVVEGSPPASCLRLVQESAIIGRVAFTLWPIGN